MTPEIVEDLYGAQVTAGKVSFMALLVVAAIVWMVIDWRSHRRMP